MWATTVIVSGNDKKERSLRLNKFAEILECLVERHNWASARAIHGAINSVPVIKMRKKEAILLKEKYELLVSSFNEYFATNNKKYREKIRKRIATGSECIPFMGVHLSDITFIGKTPPINSLKNSRKKFLCAKYFSLTFHISFNFHTKKKMMEIRTW